MNSRFQPFARRVWPLVFVWIALVGFTPAAHAFVHPGGLHTQADLDRMKAKVAAGESPWIDDWNRLLTDTSTLLTYNPGARANLGTDRGVASRDAHAAYNAIIRWYISGDTAYADKAVKICNAWSAAVNQVPTPVGTDDSIPGLSGIPIFEFAMVGELLRIYPGWAPADFERFKTMMLTYWYPSSHDFLTNHQNTCVTHWWTNWDACNIGALVAIGVLCDSPEIFQEGVTYYLNGDGNGSLLNAVPFVYPNGLGQWQESGRDQEHGQLGVGLLGAMCEVAWKQGVDLYAAYDNRLLAGAEYVARTNLSRPVPFTFYNNCDNVRNTYLSINGIGRLDDRPVWEMIYNHYVVRKGLSAPNVKKMVEVTRPEHGSIDHFGYGTLTFTLDAAASPYPASPIPPAPSDIEAEAGVGAVRLSWSPVPDDNAHGYRIQRSTTPGGPYQTIADGHQNTWPRYSDSNVVNGQTYYYVVAANNQSGTSENSIEVSATPMAAGALPDGWARQDVGSVGSAGAASYASVSHGTFVVMGNGSGIGGTADSLSYAYGAVVGDCTITARLLISGNIKVGLMMRESLGANAQALSLTLGDVGGRETSFGTRSSTGGAMSFQPGNAYTWTPVWYKLQRSGDTFIAAQSLDGVTWFNVGLPTSVAMAPNYFVGIAVCGGTATFDHVSVDAAFLAGPPGGLSAINSQNQVALSWNPSNGATSYTVKRANVSGGPYTIVATGLTTTSKHVDIGGVADHDGHLFPAVLLEPARQMLFENGPLVPAQAVALEGHEGPLQAGVQAQAIEQTHRHELALGITGCVAGVFELVAVHRPDGATGQLGKGAEPVAGLEEPVENFIGTKGHLGDHGRTPIGVECVKPSGARECLAAILADLEEGSAGIALPQDALEAAPQELLVTELRGVSPVTAIISQQPQRRLEKRFIHHQVRKARFHVTRLSIHQAFREKHL